MKRVYEKTVQIVCLTAFAFRARPEVLKICCRWQEWFMTRQLLRETSLTWERGKERDLTCKLLVEKKIKYLFFSALEFRNDFNDFWIETKLLHLLKLSELQRPEACFTGCSRYPADVMTVCHRFLGRKRRYSFVCLAFCNIKRQVAEFPVKA